MKRLSLIATLILAVLLLQNCKKDTITETATSSNTLFAVINDTTWSATKINASLTYNAAAKTKVFTCTGFATNQEVAFTITATNQTDNSASFPVQSFSDDGVATTFAYLTSTGSGNYVQQGQVTPQSGTIIFTAVDAVKKVCSGTFYFTTTQNNYDGHGNIVSITKNEVFDGAFNNMPYTFTSN